MRFTSSGAARFPGRRHVQVLEVITRAAFTTMANRVPDVTGTPLDAALAGQGPELRSMKRPMAAAWSRLPSGGSDQELGQVWRYSSIASPLGGGHRNCS
jgi:hypothetical protein